MANGPTGTCADCGERMWKSPSYRAGASKCRPCRRSARGLPASKSVNDWRAQVQHRNAVERARLRRAGCLWCGGPFPDDGPRRFKYCSAECFSEARRARGSGFGRPRPSTSARGYGSAHGRLRREMLPSAYGQPCHLCGEEMAYGQSLHLDHTEDRSGYRGFAHALCNSRDGARRARRRQAV